MWAIQTVKHIGSDRYNKSNHDVNILQKLSYRYSSHYKIIKYVGFESIHYVINLNDMFLFNVLVI